MNAGLWTPLWIGRIAVAVGALTTEVRAQEPIDPSDFSELTSRSLARPNR